MASFDCHFKPFTASDLNMAGVRQVLRSGGTRAALAEKGHDIEAKAEARTSARYGGSDHYRCDVVDHRTGAVAFVSTASYKAMLAEHRAHVLSSLNH